MLNIFNIRKILYRNNLKYTRKMMKNINSNLEKRQCTLTLKDNYLKYLNTDLFWYCIL